MNKYLAIPGNYYDKYNSKNPIERYLVQKFIDIVDKTIEITNPKKIVDIGSGEGFFSLRYASYGVPILAIDYEIESINILKISASQKNLNIDVQQGSIYQLSSTFTEDTLVLCLEVLEHLEKPIDAIKAIKRVSCGNILFSVPSEPLWSMLNLTRGKYIKSLGNTPGHIQKWSKKKFINLLSDYFEIVNIYTPIPWTIVHVRNTSI